VPAWFLEPLSTRVPYQEYVTIENELRRTVIQVCGGVLVVFGFAFTIWRIHVSERQVRVSEREARVAEESHITTRFGEAMKLLATGNTISSLGGIYALERVARDSETDHWPVLEVLTGFVRLNFPRRKNPSDEARPEAKAVMTVIARRADREEANPLDLSNCELPHVDGSSGNFESANFQNSSLRRAQLVNSNLPTARLRGADLSGANLMGADLAFSLLGDASLRGAFLFQANLFGAELELTDLRDAWLEDLTGWNEARVEGPFNISGVRQAPDGFREWALTHNAVEMKDDADWEAAKEAWRAAVEATKKAYREGQILIPGSSGNSQT
jgi:hypothetical protein